MNRLFGNFVLFSYLSDCLFDQITVSVQDIGGTPIGHGTARSSIANWNFMDGSHVYSDIIGFVAKYFSGTLNYRLYPVVVSIEEIRKSLKSAAWDNHKADNFNRLNGGNLLKRRKDMGMLHFNGGGRGEDNVCLQPKRPEYSVVPYIANHPWQWVGFHLRSQVPPAKKGYPVVLKKTVL